MLQMTCRFIHQVRRVMYGIGIYTITIPYLYISYVPGSQGGKGRVKTPLSAFKGLNHLLIIIPRFSSLVQHLPGQHLIGTICTFTSPSLARHSFPSAPFPGILLCFELRCGCKQPRNRSGVSCKGQRVSAPF